MAVGDRERKLGSFLEVLGFRRLAPNDGLIPPVPRLPGLPPSAARRITECYEALGGIQKAPLLRPRGWDHPLDGLVVELDEEQHFNRYRAFTLQFAWARTLPWAADYVRQCERYEAKAIASHSGGGFWTGAGSEKLFGPSAIRKDFSGNGSARWKQRALYDAMRDAAAMSNGFDLARLSVHDVVGKTTLGEVLRQPGPLPAALVEELQALLQRRRLLRAEPA